MTEKYKDSSLSPRERAKDLLMRMNVSEKVGQLNQRLYGFNAYERNGNSFQISEYFKKEVDICRGLGVLYGLYRADPWSGKNAENGLLGEAAVEVYNQLQAYVISHSRFGVPMLLSTECPHGHQALEGYLLPVNLAMGATFNPQLVADAYHLCGQQMNEMGVDLALISMLDVLRDPRWGRSEECFGEDPYLSKKMAEVIVKAVQSEGVAVVAKHFAAQGETTGGINASAARIGERELREIHLPSMEACVRAGVKGVMAAYNDIDGIPCHANSWLLQELLRNELGFAGIVMADGTAVDRLNILTGDVVKSGAFALNAGVDVSLWDEGFAHLQEALERGDTTMERLDKAVLRVLELKFSRGLFEHPYIEKRISSCHFNTKPENLKLARESVVLLKNKNSILPMSCNQPLSIAVIGPNVHDLYSQLGDYTPPLRPDEGITIAQGIQQVVGEAGNHKTTMGFFKGCEFHKENGELLHEAISAAVDSDVVIMVLGGTSSRFGNAAFDVNGAVITGEMNEMDCGEGVDLSEIRLPKAQRKLAEAIFDTGKKVVTLIVGGRPYDISEISEKADALLYSFYPGPQGGQAIAELLFGQEEPSGRMPVSLPRNSGQIPAYYNYRTSYDAMHYSDGKAGPLYSFGAGLGYGKPTYYGFEIKATNLLLRLEFIMENKNNRTVFGVPMVYVSRRQGNVVPRTMELKAFEKRRLRSNERCRIEIVLDKEAFAYYDAAMKSVVDQGEYTITLKDGTNLLWEKTMIMSDEKRSI